MQAHADPNKSPRSALISCTVPPQLTASPNPHLPTPPHHPHQAWTWTRAPTSRPSTDSLPPAWTASLPRATAAAASRSWCGPSLRAAAPPPLPTASWPRSPPSTLRACTAWRGELWVHVWRVWGASVGPTCMQVPPGRWVGEPALRLTIGTLPLCTRRPAGASSPGPSWRTPAAPWARPWPCERLACPGSRRAAVPGTWQQPLTAAGCRPAAPARRIVHPFQMQQLLFFHQAGGQAGSAWPRAAAAHCPRVRRLPAALHPPPPQPNPAGLPN